MVCQKLFFTGYCPVLKKNKLVKFYTDNSVGEITFSKIYLDVNENEILYLGSRKAINKAKILSDNIARTYTHFHLLKEIIEDTNIEDVGGCIQYGCVIQGEFRTFGILDYYRDSSSFHKIRLFRSLPLNFEDAEIQNLGCKIGKVLMAPFR